MAAYEELFVHPACAGIDLEAPNGEHQKPGEGDPQKSILENVKADPAFAKLAEVIEEREEIAHWLDKDGLKDATLFAPINSAFRRPGHCPGHGHHQAAVGQDDDKEPPKEVVTKVLLYHILQEKIESGKLENGQLLETSLKLASLGDRHQKIRVFEHKHHVSLNLRSHIIKDDIKSSNGLIQAVDHIVMPPPPIFSVLVHFPLEFGLFDIAIKKAGFKDTLNEKAAITVFAPSNRAFKQLGVRRLKYLFSKKGREDLKQLVAYHISTDLVYSPDIWDKKELELPTIEGTKLDIVAKEKDEDHGHKHRIIEINKEAHVFIHDGIAHNGVIHAIDKVLTPIANFPDEPVAKKEYFALPYPAEQDGEDADPDWTRALEILMEMDEFEDF
ncbi:Fasciclin domain-containing protein [Phlyctochytrium arcticum]|nr:Fasciclin domain-containing protein [Phlyctochytrium arcticum]